MIINKFENIYGIVNIEKPLELNSDITLIYANNGVMKTSFTKGISKIIKGETPEELIFNKIPSYNIEIFENNYTENNMTTIENVICFTNDLEAQKLTNIDKVVELLFNEEKNKQIKTLDDEIKKQSKNLLDNIKIKLETKKDKDLYKIFEIDYETSKPIESINKLLKLLSSMEFKEIYNIENVTGSDIKSVFNFLNKNPKLNKSIEIIDYQNFMQSTKNTTYVDNINFTITELENITNVFVNKAIGFFKNKENYIYLSEIGSEGKLFQKIENAEQLQKIYNEEYQKIYDSNEHKEKIESMKKIMIVNAEGRSFAKKILDNSKNNWIIEEMYKTDFRQKYLQTFLSELKNEIKTVLATQEDNISKINKLYNEAKSETDNTLFDKILKDFKELISLPFDIKIENKVNSVIYGEKPQTFYFEYKDNKNIKEKKDEEYSEQILSSGEKKRYLF